MHLLLFEEKEKQKQKNLNSLLCSTFISFSVDLKLARNKKTYLYEF